MQQASRREHVRTHCESLGQTAPITAEWLRQNRKKLLRIFVSDSHQALYCSIPKVACTNWKLAIMILNGKLKLEKVQNQLQNGPIDNAAVHDKFPMTKWRLAMMSIEDIMYRLENYKSFVFVRHPFSRTLSVYRNKFQPTGYSPDYEFAQRKYGTKIHLKYKTNSTNTSSNLTFTEFVKYLGDPTVNFYPDPEVDYPWGFKVHWTPMYDLCLPCNVKYDYIGKMETYQTDTQFILDKINATNLVDIVKGRAAHTTNSSSAHAMEEYSSQLSREDIKGLLWRYEQDFKLFGYDMEL